MSRLDLRVHGRVLHHRSEVVLPFREERVVHHRSRARLEREARLGVAPDGDRVEPVKKRRVVLNERGELLARQEERRGGSNGDRVGRGVPAQDELHLAHRLARRERREDDALAAFVGDHTDLARDDEVQPARLFARLDQLVAGVEHARLEVLDERTARSAGGIATTTGEAQPRLATACRRQCAASSTATSRVRVDDRLERLAPGHEQDRGPRRGHARGAGQLREEGHLTEERPGREARQDERLAILLGRAPRHFELAARHDVGRGLFFAFPDHGVARGHGEGLERGEKSVQRLLAEGAEEGQRGDPRRRFGLARRPPCAARSRRSAPPSTPGQAP